MWRRTALLLLLPLWAGCAGAAETRVAVAANLAAPMEKIAAAFTRDTGHKAVLAFGATGKFYAQVKHGAPFDLVLAADARTPQRLEQEGLAVAGSRFTYATGRLALWSATPGVVDGEGRVLREPRGRLAVADPRLAPYGAAAMEVLERLGLRAAWTPHLVQAESIGQAWQFVASGNAPLGFVALSQVMEQGRIARGSAWVVPARLHAPIRQDAVLLNPGRANPAAAALAQYLRGEAARAILRSHGYES